MTRLYFAVGALLALVWALLPDPMAFRPEDEQYLRLMQTRGREVAALAGFPDWKPWESTVLLTKGRVNYLVGPDLIARRLDPPEIPIVAAGVTRVKGQKVVVLPGKAALETAVGGLVGEMELMRGSGEAALIQGLLRTGQARQLTDEEYVGVALHEAFHLYQMEALETWANRLTEPQGELWQRVYTDAENNRLQTEEGAALLAALRAEAESDARLQARRFLALRAQRQALWDESGLLQWEAFYEWAEGLARYIQVKAGPADPLIAQIGEPVDAVMARERVYRLGAGQALLLDRLAPGWQLRATGGANLTSLLAEAVDQK